MGKRSVKRGEKHKKTAPPPQRPDYSLEDILTEYRDASWAEASEKLTEKLTRQTEEAPAETPPEPPRQEETPGALTEAYEPELVGGAAAKLSGGTGEAIPFAEDGSRLPPKPELEAEAETEAPAAEEDTAVPDAETETETPPEDKPTTPKSHRRLGSGKKKPAHVPAAEVYTDTYDDGGDLYAAAELPVMEDVEEPPETSQKGRVTPGLRRGGVVNRLWGRLVATLAVASFRREEKQKKRESAPEPEDLETEMPAAKAAKFYAGQIPSLELRFRLALAVSALTVCLSLAWGLGWPLPGLLGELRGASALCLVSLLTVMLLGLDVITNGVMSLCRGRPGAETLIALSCLLSLLDALCAMAGIGGGELSPCAVSCLSVSFALLGARLNCRSFRGTFLALSRSGDGYAVTSEQLLDRKDAFLIKSRQELAGFVRRSEEPDSCETMSTLLAPFALLAVPLLSVLLAVRGGSAALLPHTLALLGCVCAPWCALAAFPLAYAPTAYRLARQGCALAGWSGIRDVGVSKHLILTDSDIFPQGTVELSGVRILEGVFTEKVVSYTGSVLSAAGTELAGLFTELMQRSGGAMHTVADFAVGEGGAKAYIEGTQVLVGGAGYMHLCGVKISPKLLAREAVYTAFNGSLVGIFNVSYTAAPSVGEALNTLQRSRRKPIFAVRDFNIDPLLIRKKFGCSTEGFEFPSFPERYKIADVPATGESPVAAVLSGGGLGKLVELWARGRFLYFCGTLFEILTAGCTLLGLALAFLLLWQGAAALIAPWRLLLYMLLWLIPALTLSVDARR